MNIKIGLSALPVVFLVIFICKGVHTDMQRPLIDVRNSHDVVALFAQTPDSIQKYVDAALEDAHAELKAIIAMPDSERTWKNTAQAMDHLVASSNLAIFYNILFALKEVNPDAAIRQAAGEAAIKVQKFYVDVQMDPELYAAFKAYAQGNALTEDLSDVQRYFIAETLKEFERSGLGKPNEVQEQIKERQKKIGELCVEFDKNISSDRSSIAVDPSELTGMTDAFIAARKQDDGSVVLEVDYPTFFAIQKACSNRDVRQKLYYKYCNRAYPANEPVLKEIITLRDEIAKLLDYPSYAAYEIAEEMAHSVDRVQSFLADVLERATKKESGEFALFSKALPEGVELTADGRFYPWDAEFIKEEYKKKHYQLDDEKLSHYFPMEKTIEGLLAIYEQFLGLRFEQIKLDGLWSDDVCVLKVYDADTNDHLSYLLMDLHPRPFKYSHACAGTMVPSTYYNGKPNIEVSIVIANFTKPTAEKPSLLTPYEVRTFFHEFGHALHHILGRQELASMSGTHVKRDFVEMPSQMLEEWLWDKDILKMVSGHYQTGEPLSDDIINTIIALKNLNEGGFIQRQIGLGMTALRCYLEGAEKDACKILDDAMDACSTHVARVPDTYSAVNFGHLTGYGSRYYGYLWSKVFALDLFEEIKKHGLLNPEVGKRYRTLVIGQGGSKDPNELIRDFLGREPNSDAFFNDMGL